LVEEVWGTGNEFPYFGSPRLISHFDHDNFFAMFMQLVAFNWQSSTRRNDIATGSEIRYLCSRFCILCLSKLL